MEQMTQEDWQALIQVQKHLDLAMAQWNRIDRSKQNELNDMHHAEGSLAMCLRQGSQAVEDMLTDPQRRAA